MKSKYKWILGFAGTIGFAVGFFILANPFFNPAMGPVWNTVQNFFHAFFLAAFFAVMLIAFMLAFTTNLLTRAVLDVKRMKRYTDEINKWKADEKKVKELREKGTPNKKLKIKVQRKKKYIEKLQRNTATMRMKPTFITFVPFILLFFILSMFIFPIPTVVAVFPFNIAKIPVLGGMMGPAAYYYPALNALYVITNGFYMYYIGWYTICMFGFNTFLQKIMGTRFDTGSPFGI